MEKKNNSFLIGQTIIIILLIVVIIILVIGGNKKNGNIKNKNNINNNESSVKSEKIALDDSRFKDIYDILKTYTYQKNRSDGYQSFNDQELMKIIIGDLKESDFVKTSEKEIDGWNDYTIYTLDNSIVVNYLKKYFGDNVRIDGIKVVNPGFSYRTNLNIDNNSGMSIIGFDNEKYKIKWVGTGGTSGPAPKISERKIVSATLYNNEIVVKEKVIYLEYPQSNSEPIIYNVYSDSNKTNKIDTKEYTNDNINSGVITVEDYLDKASTITTTFAYDKVNDRYYFKSSVIE